MSQIVLFMLLKFKIRFYLKMLSAKVYSLGQKLVDLIIVLKQQ